MRNILLLSMSVLPREKNANYYKSVDGRYFFAGISQLEPGTKQLICSLAEKGNALDRIIVLNTNETYNPDKQTEQAYTYYLDRIKGFIKGTEDTFASSSEDISEDDREQILAMIEQHSQTLAEACEQKDVDTKTVNKVAQEIGDEFIRMNSNPQVVTIDLSEEDRDLLLEILESEENDIDVERFEMLQRKYSLLKGKSDTVLDKLKAREALYANLRLKYELQMLQDNRTKNLVKRLYQEIATLRNEIDRLTHGRENHIRAYISTMVMQHQFADKFAMADTLMEKYRTRIETKYESVDKYLDGLFEQVTIHSQGLNAEPNAIPNVLAMIMQERTYTAEKEHVCVYNDTQGGKRNTSSVLSGALELLKDADKIDIMNAYATDFKVGNALNDIADVTGSQTIFKLVAAMNEFTRYGKAKSFREYYKNYYKANGIDVSKRIENEIVKSIEAISEAILVCDMNGFHNKLKEFSRAIANYKNEPDDKKDAIFNFFVDDIRLSYGILLEKHSVIDEIQWCKDKELYQQALTIIESHVPRFFVQNKVLYYAKNQAEMDKAKTQFAEIKKNKPNADKYKLDAISNYYVKSYLLFDLLDKLNDAQVDRLIAALKLGKSCNTNNQKSKLGAIRYDIKNKGISKAINNIKSEIPLYSIAIEEPAKASAVDNMIKKYFEFAAIRNGVNHGNNGNHGNDEAITSVRLSQKIQSFVDLLKEFKKGIDQENAFVLDEGVLAQNSK